MVITSRENHLVKDIVRLQKDSGERRRQGLYVCEGMTLLGEALKSGMQPRMVFATGEAVGALPPLECPVHTVDEGVMEKMSDTRAPQGVLFTVEMREKELPQAPIIAMEALADPGNVGTIIRTADAFGVGVAAVSGGADVYSPKVVRAAMGSIFRASVFRCDLAELKERCDAIGAPIYSAALDEGAISTAGLDLSGACIIIGNEARGVSQEAREISRGSVKIPISGAQSLNAAVAAAILMWEMRR